MTSLTFLDYYINSASLGVDSALPDIHVNSYIRAPITVGKNVNYEDGAHIGKGLISTLLPYSITDGYNRERSLTPKKAAVLENDYLKAVFLPELGGRLWSLYDKKAGKELLYKNDVFQPCNLALRNAWFSGGVEWNVSIKGHNPLTCSPLFTQKLTSVNGEPILRMYEFERIREVVYIIQATLLKDALLVNITIENTSDKDKYMYWWSNIAVPETKGTRVIIPTDKTFLCTYDDKGYYVDKTSIPTVNGVDITYSLNSNRSRDFFFDIDKTKDKWISAINENGYGLLQFSDPILQGRKLFVWGNHDGGRHWNDWLSDKAGAYIEIQAGLLKTQLGHFIMKGNTKISWTECYKAISVPKDSIHSDYYLAMDTVSKVVSQNMHYLSGDTFKISKTEAPVYYGSGWGALQNMVNNTPISNICDFPLDSITDEQLDFVTLLKKGYLPTYDASQAPKSYVVGQFWLDKLKNANKDWFTLNHLGIVSYALGNIDDAKKYFNLSISATKNCWAFRNLAMIQKNIDKDVLTASNNLIQAVLLNNSYTPLIIECGETLIKCKNYKRFIDLYFTLDDKVKSNGRVRMLLGACYANLNMLDKAKQIINKDLVVDDIKEGEYALSAIWVGIYKKELAIKLSKKEDEISDDEVLKNYPLPYELDFRMH